MKDPVTSSWGQDISDADFEKLKNGFQPQDMDDKWAVSAEESIEASGHFAISVHMVRSWTGIELFVLTIRPKDGSNSARIEAITWEQDRGAYEMSEERAKEDAMVVCRYILECEFTTFPAYED